MKNLSIDEVRGLLYDVRNSQEKKTLYIITGICIAIIAAAAGVAFVLLKRDCDCFDDDLEEYWEDDEMFEDDFEYDENEE